MAVDYLIDFLRVADEYLLEELKNICQMEIIELIDQDTYQLISEMGELYNADRIVEQCQWFKRRQLAKTYGQQRTTQPPSNIGSSSMQSYAPTGPNNSLHNEATTVPAHKAASGSMMSAKLGSNQISSGGRNLMTNQMPHRKKF